MHEHLAGVIHHCPTRVCTDNKQEFILVCHTPEQRCELIAGISLVTRRFCNSCCLPISLGMKDALKPTLGEAQIPERHLEKTDLLAGKQIPDRRYLRRVAWLVRQQQRPCSSKEPPQNLDRKDFPHGVDSRQCRFDPDGRCCQRGCVCSVPLPGGIGQWIR